MRTSKPFTQFLLIGGYVAIALVIMVYLISFASSGGLLGQSSGDFKADLTEAPGLVANKSDVVNPAGVRIGVVTSVERVGDTGAVVDFKLTRDFDVHRDATVQVTTKTILGEKSLMLTPGSASSPTAKNGSTLQMPVNPKPNQPDEALNPLAGAVDKLGNVDTAALLRNLRGDLVPVLGKVDVIAQDLSKVSGGLSGSGTSMKNLSTRVQSLIEQLNASGGDIESIVSSLAVITAELNQITIDNLNQLNDILVLSANLSSAVASRQSELNAALSALPDVMVRLQAIVDTVVRAFDGERGQYIAAQVSNFASIDRMLAILKAGRG